MNLIQHFKYILPLFFNFQKPYSFSRQNNTSTGEKSETANRESSIFIFNQCVTSPSHHKTMTNGYEWASTTESFLEATRGRRLFVGQSLPCPPAPSPLMTMPTMSPPPRPIVDEVRFIYEYGKMGIFMFWYRILKWTLNLIIRYVLPYVLPQMYSKYLGNNNLQTKARMHPYTIRKTISMLLKTYNTHSMPSSYLLFLFIIPS